MGAKMTIYHSFGSGWGKCRKYKGAHIEGESRTIIGILTQRILLNNLGNDGKSVTQVE